MNNDEPSGNVMSRPLARNERSLAWKPSTCTLVPAGTELRFQPWRISAFGRAAFDRPLLFLAGLGRDLDVQPRMRVAELHLRDDAIELDRSIDIELGRKRMMRDHRRGDRSQQAATEYT